MKDFPWLYPLLFFIFILGSLLFYYQMQSNQEDQLALRLNEVVKQTALAQFDRSSRVSEGEGQLDQPAFEKDVRQKLRSLLPKEKQAPQLSFAYLQDQDTLKGIRVQLKMAGQTYQTTYYLDIHQNFTNGKESKDEKNTK